MVEFTVVLLDEWSKYREAVHEVFQDNRMIWNSATIKSLTNEELINEYKKYKSDKDIKLDKSMTGSSGIYESKSDIAIKLIKIDDVDVMLLIYHGIENVFYVDLIKRFKNIGAMVSKIVDNEITFKDRINYKLINALNDIESEKKIKVRNFIEKSNLIGKYSDDFKQQWIKCIEN